MRHPFNDNLVMLVVNDGGLWALVLASNKGLVVTRGLGDDSDRFVITFEAAGLRLHAYDREPDAVEAMNRLVLVMSFERPVAEVYEDGKRLRAELLAAAGRAEPMPGVFH